MKPNAEPKLLHHKGNIMAKIRYIQSHLDGEWSAVNEDHLFWQSAITKEEVLERIEKMMAVLSGAEIKIN